MKYKKIHKIILIFTIILLSGCTEDNVNQPIESCINNDFFAEYDTRNFEMGFSSWAYAPSEQSVNNTYQFVSSNSDIYSEHIDYKIPWNSWINNLPLPIEFTNEIDSRLSRKISNIKLALSVSLLNTDRSDLAEDLNGSIPDYNSLNDLKIEDAYYKHIQYLTSQFEPDYLIIAIEVNELLINAPEKWDAYKLLITNVKTRIQQEFPSLRISESITLHNLYKPDVPNPEAYSNELVSYANTMDFVSISFYPFFKGLMTKKGFQGAFDFLHEKINKPIAFSETSHLSEDLTVDSYNLFISGNQCEQNEYLESLLTNAQEQNYEYIIWWAHRDYNELWETFPVEVQDLGKLWISTGIINEDGAKKKAYTTWEKVLKK